MQKKSKNLKQPMYLDGSEMLHVTEFKVSTLPTTTLDLMLTGKE